MLLPTFPAVLTADDITFLVNFSNQLPNSTHLDSEITTALLSRAINEMYALRTGGKRAKIEGFEDNGARIIDIKTKHCIT